MAINDFLPFATGAGANVEGQTAYAADSMRTAGNQRGVALSSLVNKALRQGTFPTSAISKFIMDVLNEDVRDNGDLAGYEDQFIRALKRYTLSFTRESLSANRDYYVNVNTGNDVNDGLSAGTPFLTLQHSWSVIQQRLDLKGYQVVVHVADGNYAVGSSALTCAGSVIGQSSGVGSVIYVGNPGTPSNCVISSTSGNAIEVVNGGSVWFKGFKVIAPAGDPYGEGVTCNIGAALAFENFEFGACGACHIRANVGSQIAVTGNYTITGSSGRHLQAHSLGNIFAAYHTATLAGGLSFPAGFATADSMGVVDSVGMSWSRSGEPTGPRYTAVTGVVNSMGSGPSYFPGSTAGAGDFYY